MAPARGPRPAVLATTRALAARRTAFERHLAKAMRERAGGPGKLGQAVRYAALSPGKRRRPLLVLCACEAVGGEWRRAPPAAAAAECVHAFVERRPPAARTTTTTAGATTHRSSARRSACSPATRCWRSRSRS